MEEEEEGEGEGEVNDSRWWHASPIDVFSSYEIRAVVLI